MAAGRGADGDGAAGTAGFEGAALVAGAAGMGRPGAAPEAGATGLAGMPAAGFWRVTGREGDPAGPAAAGAAGRGVTLGGAGLGASATGWGGETGAATDPFAAGRGGDCTSSPSRFTANTALQTLQRARTPPSGTLAGSTR
ncbi:MAG: hypothetical protein ACJ8AV_13215 [Gemmatimonadales bacterium]